MSFLPLFYMHDRYRTARERVYLARDKTFTIKRHMSFWSEPESFDAGLDAFLAKVR